MKKMKNLLAVLAVLVLTIVAKAQDAGTYIDSLNVQDSSYMQPLETSAGEKSSGNVLVYAIIGIVLVAVIAFVVIKRKKK